MTDLDPLRKPPPDGSELPARAGRELPHDPAHQPNENMAGPTGRQRTTESVGDPDRASVASGAESGAGAGALAGAAIAGPIGLPIGAVSPPEIAVAIMGEITARLRLTAEGKR